MNLFLTGKRKSGKSTKLKSFLDSLNIQYSGVRTFVENNIDQSKTVFITSINCDSKAEIVGIRKEHKNIKICSDVFDTFGVELLSKKTSVVVIDEIGNLERFSEKYTNKVIELLKNPEIDVYGVLQEGSEGQIVDAVYKYAKVIDISNFESETFTRCLNC